MLPANKMLTTGTIGNWSSPRLQHYLLAFLIYRSHNRMGPLIVRWDVYIHYIVHILHTGRQESDEIVPVNAL